MKKIVTVVLGLFLVPILGFASSPSPKINNAIVELPKQTNKEHTRKNPPRWAKAKCRDGSFSAGVCFHHGGVAAPPTNRRTVDFRLLPR